MSLKNILTHLSVDTLKDNVETIKEASTNKDALLAALWDEEITYNDKRHMKESVDNVAKNLDNQKSSNNMELKQLTARLQHILSIAFDSSTALMVVDGKNVTTDMIISNSNNHDFMLQFVQWSDAEVINWFNSSVSALKTYVNAQGRTENWKNAREVIGFTTNFKKAYNEKMEEMPLTERFQYAYSIVFGNVGFGLKEEHKFQWWDIVDFHNPIFALVLLAAKNKDEERIVEEIRDEVHKEANNEQFDTALFVKNCMAHPDVTDILPSDTLLGVIKPELVIAGGNTHYAEVVSPAEKQHIWKALGVNISQLSGTAPITAPTANTATAIWSGKTDKHEEHDDTDEVPVI